MKIAKWIFSAALLQHAFAANFTNEHVGFTQVNPNAIVGLSNQNLWVFSLTNPKTGGSGSAGGYPSDGSGNAMMFPYQTEAFSAQQYATMLQPTDHYTLNYNVFTKVTGYDSNNAATGPYVDTISFTITPTQTTYVAAKGGSVAIGPANNKVLPYTFIPKLSQIPTPTTYPNPSFPTGAAYKGVLKRMPGGEFQVATLPSYTNAIYYAYKGMNTIRLPFSWENIQPNLSVTIDFTTGFAKQLFDFVANLAADVPTMNVILDMHNYMRYNGNIIGAGGPTPTQYASAWNSIADQFKSYSNVMFDIMNEPHNMPTELILSNYNTAIAAIRATGATNKILLEGNGYSCLGTWTSDYYGTPNLMVFVPANIIDTGNNYFINAHQYFTGNGCGQQDAACGTGEINCCVNANNVLTTESFNAFSNYLHTNNLKAIVTEVNAGTNANCVSCINNFLSAVEATSTANHASWGFIGWTTWASINIVTTDVLSVVTNPDGTDRAQWTGAFDHYLLVPNWTP